MQVITKLVVVVTVISIVHYIHISTFGFPNIVTNKINDSLEKTEYSGDNYKMSSPNKGCSSSISMWLYVNDWSYRHMHEKTILSKGNFTVYLSPKNGQFIVEIPIYNSKSPEIIKYNNFPTQKWVNIIDINDNRHLDLWVDGKLYISKYLKNLPDIDTKQKLLVADNGGFDGQISRLYTWDYAISKSTITNIFNSGEIDRSLYNKTIGKIIHLFFYLKQKIM